MAKGKSKSAPNTKVEKVVEEDKQVEDVIEKLEKVAPKKKVVDEVKRINYVVKIPQKESTTEEDIMDIKAYLTEASEMLINLSRKLEKKSKSGNRFLTASREIELINRHKIIV